MAAPPEFEMTVTLGTIVAALGICVTIIGSIIGLGWKINNWLNISKIQRLQDFATMREDFHNLIAEQDIKYLKRHNDNLEAIARIRERLAAMGNGRPAR